MATIIEPERPAEGANAAGANGASAAPGGNGRSPGPLVAPAGAIPQAAMKAQATQADLRAERLIQQVRADVDRLRALLDGLQAGQHEMSTADVEAVIADPATAATLPPWLLVRTLVRAAEELDEMAAALGRAKAAADAWEAQVHELREERAALRARTETFAQVAAALHANLEDLRFSRQAAPGLGAPAARRALASGSEGDEC
ncbi:MAG: hypothetical protein ACR2HN_12025 [Tepidiformaceae bacterium]